MSSRTTPAQGRTAAASTHVNSNFSRPLNEHEGRQFGELTASQRLDPNTESTPKPSSKEPKQTRSGRSAPPPGGQNKVKPKAKPSRPKIGKSPSPQSDLPRPPRPIPPIPSSILAERNQRDRIMYLRRPVSPVLGYEYMATQLGEYKPARDDNNTTELYKKYVGYQTELERVCLNSAWAVVMKHIDQIFEKPETKVNVATVQEGVMEPPVFEPMTLEGFNSLVKALQASNNGELEVHISVVNRGKGKAPQISRAESSRSGALRADQGRFSSSSNYFQDSQDNDGAEASDTRSGGIVIANMATTDPKACQCTDEDSLYCRCEIPSPQHSEFKFMDKVDMPEFARNQPFAGDTPSIPSPYTKKTSAIYNSTTYPGSSFTSINPRVQASHPTVSTGQQERPTLPSDLSDPATRDMQALRPQSVIGSKRGAPDSSHNTTDGGSENAEEAAQNRPTKRLRGSAKGPGVSRAQQSKKNPYSKEVKEPSAAPQDNVNRSSEEVRGSFSALPNGVTRSSGADGKTSAAVLTMADRSSARSDPSQSRGSRRARGSSAVPDGPERSGTAVFSPVEHVLESIEEVDEAEEVKFEREETRLTTNEARRSIIRESETPSDLPQYRGWGYIPIDQDPSEGYRGQPDEMVKRELDTIKNGRQRSRKAPEFFKPETSAPTSKKRKASSITAASSSRNQKTTTRKSSRQPTEASKSKRRNGDPGPSRKTPAMKSDPEHDESDEPAPKKARRG